MNVEDKLTMEFKNLAELYDFIDEEAKRRVEKILKNSGKGVSDAN
jgi:hypothetical protein